ncbi:unnamed protein product [Rotaria sp. Silwood2]|nr:unnamed protein product [Rotaria sp. Silwood2]CAF2876665.1 unnamed protein product [Rotaria sp. Silwood2]CAF3088109.1 unnamed protein product [Rotaria sp. Silwood2]CAF3255528.1 unnamed protein product [Rotaria sp. Silwood2]CAF4314574.1 unnamed protein product [Rotaria sp. Silwood2]
MSATNVTKTVNVSKSGILSRTHRCIVVNRKQLPPITSKKRTLISTLKKNSSIANDKKRLPPICDKYPKKKVSFNEQPASSARLPTDTQRTSTSFKSTDKTTSDKEYSTTQSQVHFLHPFILVWLCSNDMKSIVDYEQSISKLQQAFHTTINLFRNYQECMNFLHMKTDETIYLILSNDIDKLTIIDIHNLSQIDAIFIFCKIMPKDKQWIKDWTKIKGIFKNIDKLYEKVKQETQKRRCESFSISITSIDLNRLDSSFMYTKLLKEVLFDMEDDNKAKKELIQFCRINNMNNFGRMKIIDELEQNYDIYSPIWWYTRGCFLYDMINQSLRLKEINVIIQIRFLIRELHKQIVQLYKQPSEKLILYRGQGMLYSDFEQLRSQQGGLYSFHQFLSTTTNRDVALTYARSNRDNPELISIIFHINIDPDSLTSALFASLSAESYYKTEDECLFTMHSIFRVGEINQLEHQLWQVELSMTTDEDMDLKKLADNIREATKGSTGWNRIGKLLLNMGNFDEASEVFEILIKNSSENDLEERAHLYHLMGSVKQNKDDHEEALILFEEALKIYQSLPSSNHLNITRLYNDIGSEYLHKQEYSQALKFHQMAFDIQIKSNPLSHSDLITTYGNFGEVHKHMRHYSESIKFYEKKLSIYKKSIPFNYLNLSITYENIAEMRYNMKEYSMALKLFRKVLKIQQHRLRLDRSTIADTHKNIAKVHQKIEHYTEAILHYQYAHGIFRKSFPVNFLELAMICNEIAEIYKKMGNTLKAFDFYKEALRNLERSPNPKGAILSTIHNNIGQMYERIGNYTNAFYSYRQAIVIEKQLLLPNHSRLQSYKTDFNRIQ